MIIKNIKGQAMVAALVLAIITGVICLAAMAIALRHRQVMEHNVRAIKARYWAEGQVYDAIDWLEQNYNVITEGTAMTIGDRPVSITGGTENEIGMRILVRVFNVGTGTTDETANFRIESTVDY